MRKTFYVCTYDNKFFLNDKRKFETNIKNALRFDSIDEAIKKLKDMNITGEQDLAEYETYYDSFFNVNYEGPKRIIKVKI